MPIVKKINSIFTRRVKIQFILLLLGIIFGALLDTLALSIISPFISLLLDSTLIETNALLSAINNMLGINKTNSFLALLAFMLAFIYIFRSVYLFVLNKIQYKLLSTQQIRLSDRLLTIILNKPYLFHTNQNLANLSRIVLVDVNSLFNMILAILNLFADFFMSCFILVYLLIVSLSMTIVVLALASICVFFYLFFLRGKISEAGTENRSKNIAMAKAVNQALGSIKELKVMRKEAYFIEAFKTSSDGFVHSNQRYQVYNSLPRLFIEAICFGGAFTLVGCLIAGGTDLESLVPQISLFVLAAFRLLPAISRLTAYISTILFSKSSINAIYDYLMQPVTPHLASAKDIATVYENSKDIIIHDLEFRYPQGETPVLENVQLRIPHMNSVALTGSSGGGKTTLVDIILGIYRPDSGFVSYDGYNIHQNLDIWTKNLGYIPQQIYLLDDTIINNVAFGVNAEDIIQEQVWRALEQAQLKEFVLSLPDGLQTIIGDRGVRLSGGQRQRLGIARALYYNPPFLILDEATSALDTDTEVAVMDAMNRLQGTKTIIIIAHRMSTIQNCNIIYEVKDKRVNVLDKKKLQTKSCD